MGCCATEGASTQNERIAGVGSEKKLIAKSAEVMGSKVQQEAAKPAPAKETAVDRKTQYKSHKPITLGYWKIRGLA